VKRRLTPISSRRAHARAVARTGPLLAAGVAAVAVADGAAFRRADPDLLAHWAPTAASLATRPWRLVTALALTDGPRMTASVCLGLLVSLTLAERRLGARRALAAGLAGTVAATVVCDAALLAAAALGSRAAAVAATVPDFGASAVSAGAAGAFARSLRAPLAAVVAVATLNGLLCNHTLADWEHLVAFATGLALTRPCEPRSSTRPSSPASVP
jgi:hypothetical protein